MSVSVSVENQRQLTKETLIFVLGGALSGIVASILYLIAGSMVPALAALSFGGVIGLLANLTDPKAGTPMLRLVLAIIAGASMALLLPVHWAAGAAAAGVFLGLAFSLEDGDSTLERAFFTGLYALLMVGAVYVSNNVGAQMDAGVGQTVFAGSVWGVFLAFAGGLKRLKWTRDELLAEFGDAQAELHGDERETIRSGRVLYEQIMRELDRTKEEKLRDRSIEIAAETSRALIAITRRAQQLKDGAQRTANRRLQQRIVELDERIQAASDATVKKELQATLDEMVEQVKVRKRFDVAGARLEARQQRCFTALERLHVALVQSGSGADDAAVQESIQSLEKLSEEIRWRNLSVDELVEGTEQEDGAGVEDDTDTIVAEIRAELDSELPDEPATSVEDVVAEDVVAEDEEGDEVVFESASAADSVPSEDPPGTDGSVSVEAAEQETVAQK